MLCCVCSIGASLHIYRTSLENLDLRSLTSIRNGGVFIKFNPRLCYADTVQWDLIQSSPDQKLLVTGNANASQCGTWCQFFVLISAKQSTRLLSRARKFQLLDLPALLHSSDCRVTDFHILWVST